MRRSSNEDILRTSISGQFGFQTQPTALEGTANTGFGLASLLVGFPNSLTLRATDPLDPLQLLPGRLLPGRLENQPQPDLESGRALGNRYADDRQPTIA